jgi:hypothetical protein
MAWWTIPAIVTGASALLGYKSSKDANKTQQAAINAQQSAEQQKMAVIRENMDLADQMLKGGGNYGTGAESQANQWTSDYLNWLKTAPDTTYNAQRGQMEGNIRSSMEQAARIMGKRGLTGGVANSMMQGIGMQRAGLLGSLEAQRNDRRGQNLAAGSQLTQTLLDRALNLRSAATGTAMNFNSQIPMLMQGQAAQQNQTAGAWGGLTSALLNGMMATNNSMANNAAAAAGKSSGNPFTSFLIPGR